MNREDVEMTIAFLNKRIDTLQEALEAIEGTLEDIEDSSDLTMQKQADYISTAVGAAGKAVSELAQLADQLDRLKDKPK
jgi:ABC-type transporter Mla subunit MlaD